VKVKVQTETESEREGSEREGSERESLCGRWNAHKRIAFGHRMNAPEV